MAKLIAFYSRADENYFGGQYRYVKVGNTEKVAKMISDLTGADMFKIEQKVPYSANYKECVAQSVKDLKSKARPELVSLPNLDDYDEIYLGYPNYCGTMPMAVYTFLEAFDFTGKTIHPFCTHEGSGLSNTVNDIKNTAKGATVTNGLPLFGSDADKAEGIVNDWIKKNLITQEDNIMKIADKNEFEKQNVFGTGTPNTAYAKYFIGESYLNPLTKPEDGLHLLNVTFEPSCRNNWHIHHAKSGGGQLLICTAGEGWYQEEGKEPVSLTPGKVIVIPAEVKHWHGAKKDSWFSHIATEMPGEECSNEWCEPVTDEEYNKLG